MATGPATAPPAQAPPPRIRYLRLCDFRGFPGPATTEIDFKGKNLLVYGENGAGKSSIFHALDHFFSIADGTGERRKARLLALQNRYPKPNPVDCFVEVEFSNGGTVRWDDTQHPANLTGLMRPPNSQIVVDAALRKAVFDYRALLETNFRHHGNEINLFDVVVRLLLRDYPVSGGPSGINTVYELWQHLDKLLNDNIRIKVRNGLRWRRFRDDMSNGLDALNTTIRQGLDDILARPPGSTNNVVNDILIEMGWSTLSLTDFSNIEGSRFHWDGDPRLRKIIPGTVTPEISFCGLTFDQPHDILNEARLSALAIAMYLAGREICTRGITSDPLRLMVLDDLLIGLDQANRQPVLNMLSTRYTSDWQIILMTHDRVWFEMARQSLPESEWGAVEMYEEVSPAGYPSPMVLPLNTNPISANIDKARAYHNANEYPAAALHARMALEQVLKKTAHDKRIPIQYDKQIRRVSSDSFLSAFRNWLSGKPEEPAIQPHVSSLELARNIVLNPFSHSTPVTLGHADVLAAIDAVEDFYQILKTENVL